MPKCRTTQHGQLALSGAAFKVLKSGLLSAGERFRQPSGARWEGGTLGGSLSHELH